MISKNQNGGLAPPSSEERDLHDAIWDGRWDDALTCIEAGVGTRAFSPDGSTTLMAAIESMGSLGSEAEMTAARTVALACIPHVDARAARNDGWTALAMACARGEYEIIEALAPMSSAGDRFEAGASPLMLAAQSGNAPAVETVLKLRLAGVDEVDQRGRPAILWASDGLGEDALQKLLPSDLGAWRLAEEKTLLMAAVEQNSFNIAQALILRRRWDEQDVDGNTALAIAARGGNIKMLRELVDYSDPAIVNNFGESALMQAARGAWLRHFKEGVELLLEFCDPSQLNHEGRCALEIAIIDVQEFRARGLFNREGDSLGAVEALARATTLSGKASGGEDFTTFAYRSGNEELGRLIERVALMQRENVEISKASPAPKHGRRRGPRSL